MQLPLTPISNGCLKNKFVQLKQSVSSPPAQVKQAELQSLHAQLSVGSAYYESPQVPAAMHLPAIPLVLGYFIIS